jgi:hypothetical protein
VRTIRRRPTTLTCQGPTELLSSERRAFAVLSTSHTVLTPVSNVFSVTNTATCMAEIVSKMSNPSLAMSAMSG